MTRNTGIVSTGGNIVINGDMNVGGSDDNTQQENVGIVTTGDDAVVINGSFNVGASQSNTPPQQARQ